MSASKRKKDCPSCSIRPIVFIEDAVKIIDREKIRLKEMRLPQRERTFDKVVNRIITQWGLWDECQKTQL